MRVILLFTGANRTKDGEQASGLEDGDSGESDWEEERLQGYRRYSAAKYNIQALII